MEFLLMLLVLTGIVYSARNYQKKHDISSLPTLQQLKLEQEKEDYLVLGMMEVNQFLAPRQLPEPVWVDIGCSLCDSMRMNVTENELEAEGWTHVNGTTRCPACSAGKKPRFIWSGTCGCGAAANSPQDCICNKRLGQPDKFPYWCQRCKGWTSVKHLHEQALLGEHVHNNKCGCNAC